MQDGEITASINIIIPPLKLLILKRRNMFIELNNTTTISLINLAFNRKPCRVYASSLKSED